MIHAMAFYAVGILSKHAILNKKDAVVCQYALELAIYTFMSTLAIMCFGLLVGHLLDVLIATAVFYTNQTTGGGYHADTHLNCFVSMLLGLCASLFLSVHFHTVSFVLCISSLIIMFFLPVVLHPNKKYLENKTPSLIKRARFVYAGECVILLTVFLLHMSTFDVGIFSGLIWSAVSRILGVYQQKHRR